MKMTFACPNCGVHKTVRGRPGQKKILVCKNCRIKGVVSFPVQKQRISKKQVAVFSVAFVLLLCFAVLVVIPGVRGDLRFLTVRSGSMEPSIHVGDVVVVSTVVGFDDVNVGDVITFRYSGDSDPNRFITHRVADIVDGEFEKSFKTKGDANEEEDLRTVSPSELVGKTVMVIPFVGYFTDFARSAFGYVLFILVPAVLIISFEVVRIFRIRKKEAS